MNVRGSSAVIWLMALVLTLWTASLYTQTSAERRTGAESMEKVYTTILDRYVAEVDPEKLAEAAIEGMLEELDPYSQHITEGNSHRLDAITTGEYGGVGIRLGRMGDSLIVISPMDGTPAYHQGIQSGDRIIRIDSISTRDMSVSEAADLVRGEKGSLLTLLIMRAGEKDLLSFELERELIKVPDVSYSGLLDNRMGYIKLSNFSKYSSEELEKSVRKLDRTRLNGLIIDLRGNPGGLLSAALQSADLFIPKGALLLETRGRQQQSNRKYHARRRPIVDADLPITILIDGGSASASEILSGVLQDYDRAVLIGEPSFGKGLVQTVTTLDDETRLKLTTAKYYLPSGRLIQKRDIASKVVFEDVLDSGTEEYLSESKRAFQAGAGVSPDLYVEDMPVSVMEREFWRQRSFFKYALEYVARNPGSTLPVHLEETDLDQFLLWLDERGDELQTQLSKWLSRSETILDSSSILLADWMELRDSLQELQKAHSRAEFQRNQEQMLSGLEMEIARVLGGNGARIEASLEHDPVVDKALELMQLPLEYESILAGTGEPKLQD